MAIEEEQLFTALGVIVPQTLQKGAAIAIAFITDDDVIHRVIAGTLSPKSYDERFIQG